VAIDYNLFKFAKVKKPVCNPGHRIEVARKTSKLAKDGKTPKKKRAARKRKKLKAAAVDRDTKVMPRYGGKCVAVGVSPVCTVRAEHPHELIPRGVGGPAESWNREPICAADHRECQGRVGGNRLIFDWPGKSDGARPNADVPGNVTVKWVEHPRGNGR
jgi:hypothetical protein